MSCCRSSAVPQIAPLLVPHCIRISPMVDTIHGTRLHYDSYQGRNVNWIITMRPKWRMVPEFSFFPKSPQTVNLYQLHKYPATSDYQFSPAWQPDTYQRTDVDSKALEHLSPIIEERQKKIDEYGLDHPDKLVRSFRCLSFPQLITTIWQFCFLAWLIGEANEGWRTEYVEPDQP